MIPLPIAAQQYVPTIGPIVAKNSVDRQTYMDEPLRCSSLMLEREEHLKACAVDTESLNSQSANQTTGNVYD
jgi:hypothetical protein